MYSKELRPFKIFTSRALKNTAWSVTVWLRKAHADASGVVAEAPLRLTDRNKTLVFFDPFTAGSTLSLTAIKELFHVHCIKSPE